MIKCLIIFLFGLFGFIVCLGPTDPNDGETVKDFCLIFMFAWMVVFGYGFFKKMIEYLRGDNVLSWLF